MLLALLLHACTSGDPKDSAGDTADCTTPTEYQDADKDGYGDPSVLVCDGVPNPDDCDDADPNVHPNLIDDCNDFDDNCDGVVDDHGDGTERYPDEDGDGWGDESRGYFSCDATGVTTPGDCDDADATISPDAAEVPGDGIDNDCDGYTDEA